LCAEKIPQAAREGAKAVMTSNLYGIPDDIIALKKVCDRHGLLLIEDCSHAIGSTIAGQRVGTFGDVSIFSLAKHIGKVGGIVTGRDTKQIEAIRKRAEANIISLSAFSSLATSSRQIAREMFARFPRIKTLLKTVLSPFIPTGVEEGCDRTSHRMPIHLEDFQDWEKRKPLQHYDDYLNCFGPFRKTPCWYALYKTFQSLSEFEQKCSCYQEWPKPLDWGSSVQQAIPSEEASVCYFRVPLFVTDRDLHYRALTEMGFAIDFIYDPPFPDYVPASLFTNLITDPAASRRWSRDILPIKVSDLERVRAYFLQIAQQKTK
jgi:hypothetical protein